MEDTSRRRRAGGEKHCPVSECKYTSNQRTNVLNHLRMKHTFEKLHCPFSGCDYRTTDAARMSKHKRTVHMKTGEYQPPRRRARERNSFRKPRVPTGAVGHDKSPDGQINATTTRNMLPPLYLQHPLEFETERVPTYTSPEGVNDSYPRVHSSVSSIGRPYGNSIASTGYANDQRPPIPAYLSELSILDGGACEMTFGADEYWLNFVLQDRANSHCPRDVRPRPSNWNGTGISHPFFTSSSSDGLKPQDRGNIFFGDTQSYFGDGPFPPHLESGNNGLVDGYFMGNYIF